ncbi:type II secretion system protein [Cyanobacterium aponinum UTEX 3221]|uniref:pilus assembly FimT family protein n=1 Tax=Cyanobacterium aponinum TaxID=379064 RepID=UPI002B4C07AB|nr:type II secretion system protein [Cyanobacterium aponinum]WRL36900.1 type II secretion system protein [Cyanobacterium aponinum UTEX 3221]
MRFSIAIVKLLLNRHKNEEKGFNLLEVVLVSVIVGIMAAVSVPNLLEQQRQERVNEAFNKIRGALVEAQTNANRKSRSCTVVITTTQVSSYLHVDDDGDPYTPSEDDDDNGLDPKPITNPESCTLENIAIDDSIVEMRSTASGGLPQNITFDFDGNLTKTTQQTIHLKRKNAPNETGKCIVISNQLGTIRTGIYDSVIGCNNPENKKYDSFNP